MNTIRWTLAVAAVAMVAGGALAGGDAGAPPGKEDAVILENDLLKVAVSPVGGRVVSLFDKVRQRENVRNQPPYGGMNIVRFGKALNLNDMKDRYELTLSTLPDGARRLLAVARVSPTEDKPDAATVTKEYVLVPGSSCLRLALEVRNEGQEEIGLIPWVQHLLLRGTREQPEESHMTAHGVFVTGKPAPHERAQVSRADRHYFPAAHWTSRVVLPVEDAANTLATVMRPEDMFKIYNWHRSLEDFATQEVIAQPLFAAPGKTFRLDYAVTLAAPVRNIAYASPDLVIGVSPHPTWLTADTKELALDFAATRSVPGLKAKARLVAVAQPDKVLQESDFTVEPLTSSAVVRHPLAVALQDKAAYQLRLTFSLDGRPYVPGAALGDRPEIVIPLVVGEPVPPPVVFPKPAAVVGRLRQIQPQERPATLAYACDAFDAFSYPSAQRVFCGDTFTPTGKAPLRLYAGAGEYESIQLVLIPKNKADAVMQVAGADLAGPGGASVAVESVNDFIYVPTRTPSQYNARFPVGEYPEALLPVKQITMKPEGNHPVFITWRIPPEAKPGLYRGAVTLAQGTVRHEIPVELKVWNIRLPLRSPYVEFASSLKGRDLREARHPDGTPYTAQEQLEAIEAMHLKYRLTPCDSGLAGLLLQGDYEAFEKKMTVFVAAGATKIYLGSSQDLIKRYGAKLAEIETYLKKKGWLDYFYVRPGFDEASPDLVPKIKAALQAWKQVSSIPTMETYYNNERATELFGLLDIWTRSSIPPLFDERIKAGDKFWKVNAMPGHLEDEPWTTGRQRYIAMWDTRYTGSYIWTVKAWSGVAKWGEDHWCDGGVGNLSAVLMWPHATGILSTIRLEAMRDGLEDNTMLWMLREKVAALDGKTLENPAQAAALAEARTLCGGGPLAPTIKSVDDLEKLRIRAGEALSALNDGP